MKLQKRLLSLLLCAVLVFGLCLPTAAEEETSGDFDTLHWSFEETSGTLTITCTAAEGVPMPDFASNTIPWESHSVYIKSVVFSDGGRGHFTSIGRSAFYGCTNLTAITLPDGLTSIGGYAFSDCTNLTTITLPDGLTTIGTEAFYLCESLETMQLPDRVTSIGDFAFSD